MLVRFGTCELLAVLEATYGAPPTLRLQVLANHSKSKAEMFTPEMLDAPC
jgi:hypothetical protein